MEKNVCVEKSFAFSVRIVNLYKYLNREHKEYVLSKQLLRCGTSIGANVSEAQRGQSKADFAAKMNIALKEANETEYWLRLLFHTSYINQQQFESIHADALELIGLLTTICKTANAAKYFCILHFERIFPCPLFWHPSLPGGGSFWVFSTFHL